jgi:hypothetical protein
MTLLPNCGVEYVLVGLIKYWRTEFDKVPVPPKDTYATLFKSFGILYLACEIIRGQGHES